MKAYRSEQGTCCWTRFQWVPRATTKCRTEKEIEKTLQL